MVRERTDTAGEKNRFPFGPGGPGGRHGGRFAPVRKPKNTKATLKRLWVYLSKQKLILFIVFLFVMLSSVLDLAGPFLMGKATIILFPGILRDYFISSFL